MSSAALDAGWLRRMLGNMSALTTPPTATSSPASQPTASAPKSDFMAAEEIKGILQGRDKPEQERIIRWVTESLGLAATPAVTSTHAAVALTPAMPPPAAVGGPHIATAGARSKDIKLFTDEKKPKSDMQFAAVVAYYYAFEAPEVKRKAMITADDLQEASRLAGRKRFDTPTVPLNNAIRQGYLDRVGRGEFKLNAVGENLVAMALPGTGGDANNTKPRRQKRKQKKHRNKSSKSASAS
jgi:hypothetical protein